MEIMRPSPNLLLVVCPRRKVPRPVRIGIVRVREHVIIFSRPGDVVAVDSINVGAWGRVKQIELITIMLVHILNHCIHVLIVLKSIDILKVTSKEDKHIVSHIMLTSLLKVVDEPCRQAFSVEVFGLEVVDPKIAAFS